MFLFLREPKFIRSCHGVGSYHCQAKTSRTVRSKEYSCRSESQVLKPKIKALNSLFSFMSQKLHFLDSAFLWLSPLQQALLTWPLKPEDHHQTKSRSSPE
jgi:hypothetical protein